MITTGITAKLHLFHLFHTGVGRNPFCLVQKIVRTLKEVCYGWDLCYGLPSCQDTPKTSARRWMAMARWGERQGVQAKSSNPKPYSNLTLIDNNKKKNHRRKGDDSMAHQQSAKYLKGEKGQLALWWHPHERNWTLDFLAFY